MLYYLFEYIEQSWNLPGAGLFGFISFRAAMAVILSLLLATVYGKKIINLLQKNQLGETIRDLGLEGQKEKAGTPTMGGLIIIMATLIPTLLFARLDNIYILLLIIATVWMGVIGFIDDYIKIFKKEKEGLKGRFKLLGQLGLGIIVGTTLYFHPEVTVKQEIKTEVTTEQIAANNGIPQFGEEEKSTLTTIPFFKNNEFNYSAVVSWITDDVMRWSWIVFIPIVIFIIMAVSNAVNLTDGIDGLAAGSSAIVGGALAIFAWVSGHIVFSDYLNIMYIPRVGEINVFIMAFVGALIGFLWYNAYPAQVFMGDTGSLTIGGIIAVIALIIRKELLIPLLCAVFMAEALSVMIQVSYFKYSRKKYGHGRRIFLMSPLHHHFQKKGYHESKIVTRFWIVGILLAIMTIVTLKIR